MKRIVLRFECIHCRRGLEIRPACEERTHGFSIAQAPYHCPSCGQEFSLQVQREENNKLAFQITGPTGEWTYDDILRREG